MSEILADLDAADAIMDDVIVYGQTEEHDERLDRVLDRIQEVGFKFNRVQNAEHWVFLTLD